MDQAEFDGRFQTLTGYAPMPWQRRLYQDYFGQGQVPAGVDVPTGLGKTKIVALWLIALQDMIATGALVTLPRRLVYVVDRRAVVDQATRDVEEMRKNAGGDLPISTLRGRFLDNRQWLDDPSRPAVIVGTVDMIGSRLLFGGYGVSRRSRPFQAGFLGADSLIVLDEAHLVPPFERLLEEIERDTSLLRGKADVDRKLIPPLRLLSLSATGRERQGAIFSLADQDLGEEGSITRQRLGARKRLTILEADLKQRPTALADAAWAMSGDGQEPIRCLVFCDSRDDAEKICADLAARIKKRAKDNPDLPRAEAPELFIGARRLHERETAATRLESLGFLASDERPLPRLSFLVATSAAEVGVDLDADHMVCDLAPWDRMIQRLGRVNRRVFGNARVTVIDFGPLHTPKSANKTELQRIEQRHQSLRELLQALPRDDDGYDVSPGALRNFKTQSDQNRSAAIALASSPAPLRPALNRALLDAWSMTGLKEHTGRPDVAPWLRGWIDEFPQTRVVWRAHLPVRPRDHPNLVTLSQQAAIQEANAYFSAAPVHVLEQLETETYRVETWLVERTRSLLKIAEGAGETGEQAKGLLDGVLGPDDIVAMAMDGAGDLTATLTLNDLANVKSHGSRLRLANQTLVLTQAFAGLSPDGTLDHRCSVPPAWVADLNQTDAPAPDAEPIVPWQVQSWQGEPPAPPGTHWYFQYQFVLRRNAEGQASAALAVFKWRGSAPNEDQRSVAGHAQTLAEHQSWAEENARRFAIALRLPEGLTKLLVMAARLHDEGKQLPRWQGAFQAPSDGGPYAKTRGPVNQRLLDGYRHELGSLFFAEKDPEFRELPTEDQDLVLHLIAAHHGNARPVIGTRGCDLAPPSKLAARAREVALRFAAVQRRWGPWGLAWLESLVRAADQQASKQNDETRAKGER